MGIFVLGLFLMILSKVPSTLLASLFTSNPLNEESNVLLEDTTLLIWFWPIGWTLEPDSCSSKFNIDGCHLTADKSLYTKADGVLLHHRDIAKNLSNLPKTPRPFHQLWLCMLFESPKHSTTIPDLDHLVNITIGYHAYADIVFYRRLVLKREDTIQSIPLPAKTKSVCRLDYGHQVESPEILKYYNDLKEHIHVDVFGQHNQDRLSVELYSSAIKSCKFYLALESTKDSDEKTLVYVSEKLYNSLKWGTVPVVWGPSKKVYEGLIPRGAFIHVDDFSSPRELAAYLQILDKREDLYNQLLWWRKQFTVTNFAFPLEHACVACRYIREKKKHQILSNLDQRVWKGE